MLRFFLLLAAGIGVAGCAPDADVDSAPARHVVPAPRSTERGTLALIGPRGMVRVGDTVQAAALEFREPERAVEFATAPPGFNPPYEAFGWDSAAEGFGVITYEGVIVLAMHRLYNADAEMLERVLDLYEGRFGSALTQISGPNQRYWFWSEGDHRLMLHTHQTAAGLLLTEMVGDTIVMNAVRASPDHARLDTERLQATSGAEGLPVPGQSRNEAERFTPPGP
jgi:hypothetical protein